MERKKQFNLPGFQIRRVENTDSYEFRISDETKDRHGAIILASAWDCDNYMKSGSGIVCYNHQWGGENPDNIIGKAMVEVKDGELIGNVVFESGDTNITAAKIRSKVDKGILNSTSVGFLPIEYSMGNKERGEDPTILYFRKVELLEFSIVDIPSNPNAVRKSLDDYKPKKEELKGMGADTASQIIQLNINLSKCLN